ncbi:MAG: hypothetical protein ABR991_12870, partial [Terracidiphilus sp.]
MMSTDCRRKRRKFREAILNACRKRRICTYLSEATRVGASTVSDLDQKIYGKINEWREWPLVGDFPCAYLDGLW